MKKLIFPTLFIILLLTGCERTSFYDYALTLDDNAVFVGTDHVLYKSLNRKTGSNKDGSIDVVDSGKSTPWNVDSYTSKKRAEDMELHDFIFATDTQAYIRNDGSIWISNTTHFADKRLAQLLPRNDAISDESPDSLSISLLDSSHDMTVSITNSGDAPLSSPCAYLFVQLADVGWYTAHYPWLGAERDMNMENGETREYDLLFPRNGKSYIPGKYRICFYTNIGVGYNLSFGGPGYYTLPIPDTAKLIATVEFELDKSILHGFKLSGFESSGEDFSAEEFTNKS